MEIFAISDERIRAIYTEAFGPGAGDGPTTTADLDDLRACLLAASDADAAAILRARGRDRAGRAAAALRRAAEKILTAPDGAP